MHIRPYHRPGDETGIKACIIELQDFEREFDPRMPSGAEIADEYISDFSRRCNEFDGQIFVADASGKIAGYVMVLASVRSGDIDDGNLEHGLIADLVVLQEFRGNGVGKRLMATAETYAKEQNVNWLRISVLAKNLNARSLYANAGFSELYVDFEKDLSNSRSSANSVNR